MVQDATRLRDLSLELGYRHSDYSTSGSTPSYKAQISWAPTDSWKFRAGFNRASASPNVQGALLAAGLRSRRLGRHLCERPESRLHRSEQCARTGVTAAQYGSVLTNPADQYNTYGGGNPVLDPEMADTITFGIVWTPQSDPGPLDHPRLLRHRDHRHHRQPQRGRHHPDLCRNR